MGLEKNRVEALLEVARQVRFIRHSTRKKRVEKSVGDTQNDVG